MFILFLTQFFANIYFIQNFFSTYFGQNMIKAIPLQTAESDDFNNSICMAASPCNYINLSGRFPISPAESHQLYQATYQSPARSKSSLWPKVRKNLIPILSGQKQSNRVTHGRASQVQVQFSKSQLLLGYHQFQESLKPKAQCTTRKTR